MTYTERLEHETEQTRSQIASTLDELRACMTPGQVFNRIAHRVGDAGGAAFVANLKRQTINNPVPVALIGAGLAWLIAWRPFGDEGTRAGWRCGRVAQARRIRRVRGHLRACATHMTAAISPKPPSSRNVHWYPIHEVVKCLKAK